MNKVTFHQPFSLDSVHLISGLNCLEKNTQAQPIVTIHSVPQHAQGDFSLVLQSSQRALDIRLKLFGEDHSSTADSYHSLGLTQHALGDLSSATQSKQRALDVRLKLLGEDRSSTIANK